VVVRQIGLSCVEDEDSLCWAVCVKQDMKARGCPGEELMVGPVGALRGLVCVEDENGGDGVEGFGGELDGEGGAGVG
jgi:hypothetical protein